MACFPQWSRETKWGSYDHYHSVHEGHVTKRESDHRKEALHRLYSKASDQEHQDIRTKNHTPPQVIGLTNKSQELVEENRRKYLGLGVRWRVPGNDTNYMVHKRSSKVKWNEWKYRPQTRRKYLQSTCLAKNLYPEYLTNSQNFQIKTRQPNLKIDRRPEQTIHKEDIHILNGHVERASLHVRERQIKTRMRYHNTKCWGGCRGTGTLACH